MSRFATVVLAAVFLVGCGGSSTRPEDAAAPTDTWSDVSVTPIEGAPCRNGDAGQYYTCPGDDHDVCPAWPGCYWQCTGGHWVSSQTYDGAIPNFDQCPTLDIWQWRRCACWNHTGVDTVCSGIIDGGCPVTCTCPAGAIGTVTCVVDGDAGVPCPQWP